MQTAMTNRHSMVPSANISRSSFDRSSTYKTAFDASYLVPFHCDSDILPGDTVNFSVDFFVRMTTPIVPIMDNLWFEHFDFFVPHRLVWNNFQRFMGEQANPGDSIDFLWPQMTAPVGGYAIGSLQDYLGLPTGIAAYTHNSAILRAYQLIWNEWFRDENLQNSVTVDKGDGPDTPANYALRKRGKRYDYFTSCLPALQKGPAVSIPITGNAPIVGFAVQNAQVAGAGAVSVWETNAAAAQAYPAAWATTQTLYAKAQSLGAAAAGNTPQIFANLAAVSGVSINALRQSYSLQLFLERDMRGGTRYVESIKSHYNVVSPDFRLQRSEFLGSGISQFSTHAIPQTSSTDATTPQGNLSAFTTCSGHHKGYVKSFTEHGIIISLMNVRADLTYQQGLDRMWTRRTRYDTFFPTFAHLGEQSVLNKEIYCQGNANDDLVFGYQSRYDEMRYGKNLITGKLRSTAAATLDRWHLAENFAALPVLNAAFIEVNVPMTRVLAVAGQPNFVIDMRINKKHARPMPLFGVPGWQTNL